MVKLSSRATKGIFLFAILAFLAASLAHVAWLYRLYEPGTVIVDAIAFRFDFWNVVSYALAIGIDVLIAWLILFYTVMSKRGTWILWAFIIILCAYSYYCNFLYTMAHNPQTVANLWSIPLIFGLTTTGYVTPLVVSAYPVFIVMYTFLSSKLTGHEETPEELRKKADTLQEVQIEKARITTLKRTALKNRFTGAIDMVSDIRGHMKTGSQKPSETVPMGKEEGSSKGNSEKVELDTEPLVIPLETQNQVTTHIEPLVSIPPVAEETLQEVEPLSEQNGHTPGEQAEMVLVGNQFLPVIRKNRN